MASVVAETQELLAELAKQPDSVILQEMVIGGIKASIADGGSYQDVAISEYLVIRLEQVVDLLKRREEELAQLAQEPPTLS